MKGLLFLILLCSNFPFVLKAQNILQLNSYYSSHDSKAKSTFVTENQSIYIAGEFKGEIIVGFNYSDAQLKNSVYFSKQQGNGDIPFMSTFYSTGEVFVSSILSRDNQVYIGGTYTDSLFIGNDTLYNGNFKGVYIGVFDTLGNYQFAIHPESYSSELYDMTFTSQNELVLCGEYFGSFEIGSDSLNASLGFNMFVIKYNLIANEVNWVKSSSGTATNGKGVRVDSQGNVYVIGSYGNSTTFDAFSLPSVNGDHNAFIAKYSSDGIFQWAQTITSPVQAHGLGLELTSTGDIYVTGEYEMNLDIPQIGSLSNVGLMDAFIAKLNSDGDFIWAKTIQSELQDQGLKIVVDINDNPIVLSNAGTNINFNGLDLSSDGYIEPILLKLNKFDGSYIWHCRIPSAPESGIVNGYSIALNNDLISVCGSNRTGIFYQNEVLDSPNLDDSFWAIIRDTNNAEIDVSALEEFEFESVFVSPNPFNNTVTVHLNDEIKTISLFDAKATLLNTYYPTGQEFQINEELPSGIYHLRIETQNKILQTKIYKL